MPIWYLFTGFVMEMLLLRVENSLPFPNRTLPDSRVSVSVHNKLHEAGALPSSHISSERANEQNVDEAESIFQSVECSPTSTRRISTRIGVPHTITNSVALVRTRTIPTEYDELYVSTACILFVHRWATP